MKEITAKQLELLGFIDKEITTKGQAPSLAEIGERMHCTAKCARDHVQALEKKGFVKTERGIARGIKVVPQKVK